MPHQIFLPFGRDLAPVSGTRTRDAVASLTSSPSKDQLMRLRSRLTDRVSHRHNRSARSLKRTRRALFEQFEDRRLLAVAHDDSYTILANNTLEDDLMANDE